MDQNIIAFPTARVARVARDLPRHAAATRIVSIEKWKRRARPHRTANGVFFMTNVLTTSGDFA